MKHIISAFAAAALLAVSCTPDLDRYMVDDVIGFSALENITEPSLLRDGLDFAILKSGKGQNTSEGAEVEIAPCGQSEVDAYNSANGTDYKMAPTTKFTLSTTKITFKKEDARQIVHVDWDKNYFCNTNESGDHYVIALKITSSSIKVDSTRSVLLVRPLLSSVSFQGADIKNLYPGEADVNAKNTYEGVVTMDNAIATNDATIQLSVDNSLIAAISAEREVEYTQAPSGLFNLDETSVTVKAGENYGYFKYTVNLSVLFDASGKFKEQGVRYIVPIKMGSSDPELLGKGPISTGYIVITVADDDTVTPPVGVPMQILHGPWEILEGADNHIGMDPKCDAPSWYGNYNVTKLVDWNFANTDDATVNGYWGSWFWTEPNFPLEFVFDLGTQYIFGEFYKVDATKFQGQFRQFEIYVAREYAGPDTDWKLAAKGRTGFKGWQAFGDGSDVEGTLEKFSYIIPDPEEEGGEFNYTKGQYVKYVIVKTENAYPSDSKGGYLSEFYAKGWEL